MRQQQSRAALAAWQAFLSTPLDTVLALHREVDPQQAVVDLFQSVVASVPAYQAFLAEYNVDAAAINTFDAFQRLPLITKKN